jgi:hypothetical protein
MGERRIGGLHASGVPGKPGIDSGEREAKGKNVRNDPTKARFLALDVLP